MKREQFYKYKVKYGKAFEATCRWIDPDDIIEFHQKRAGGNQVDNEVRYRVQFTSGAEQIAPVSVVPLGGGKYIVKDGSTRTRAKQAAKKEDQTQRVFITDFQHKVLGYGSDEWSDEQDRNNDHYGEKPASEKTMKRACEERVKSGRYDSVVQAENGGVFLDKSNPEEFGQYVKLAGKWTKNELFSNSAKTWVWYRNKISAAINKVVPMTTRVKTFSTGEMLTSYSNNGKTAYHNTTDGTGQVSNGEKVIEVVESKRIHQNVYGKILHARVNSSCKKLTVMLNYNNSVTNTKSDQQIIDQATSDVISIARADAEFTEKSREIPIVVKRMPILPSDNDKIATLWETGDPIPVAQNGIPSQSQFQFTVVK